MNRLKGQAQMTPEQKDAIDKAKHQIRHALRVNGPFSHNIIQWSLTGVAKQVSYQAANDLIDELKLEPRGYMKVTSK